MLSPPHGRRQQLGRKPWGDPRPHIPVCDQHHARPEGLSGSSATELVPLVLPLQLRDFFCYHDYCPCYYWLFAKGGKKIYYHTFPRQYGLDEAQASSSDRQPDCSARSWGWGGGGGGAGLRENRMGGAPWALAPQDRRPRSACQVLSPVLHGEELGPASMPTPRGGPGTAVAGTPCALALHRETQLGFTWVSLSLETAVVPEGHFFL